MRKSSVTEYTENCLFTGTPTTTFHHLLFGSDRRKADEDGLVIPVTDKRHNLAQKSEDRIHGNPVAEDLSKMFGQAIWERNYCAKGHTIEEARAAFMERYGKAYY